MLVSHKDIIDRIKSDKEINFVAFAMTPWHAIGCNASLLKLKNDISFLKGFIILPDRSNSENQLLRQQNFAILKDNNVQYELLYHDGRVFSSSKSDNIKTKIDSIKYFASHEKGVRRIYILSPLSINDVFVSRLKKALPEADIINVVVDEGLGSYMRSDFNWAVEQYHNTKSVKEFIRCLFDLQKKKLFTKKSQKRNEYINNNLLIKSSNGFKENNDITEYYKQVIGQDKIYKVKYKDYENAAVISAQLYFEDGQIKKDADLELYKSVISAFAEKGISVVFKPHPRDKDLSRYECLNCIVDNDNTVSQEIIFASLPVKPCVVLSFTSTGLVTSNLFYDIKTASLNRLLKNENVQLTLQNEFSNFEKAFGNVVFVPKAMEDLIEYVIN